MDKTFDRDNLTEGVKKGAIPSSFDMISLTVASPEDIESWSYGEVKKSETINYRTQKPERDGLFCERIFGPTKNWECYCGKYKKIKHKNLTCDKCGVDVTHSSVRRDRMGHIALAVPVSHIWYVRSTPSRIGLLLDLSIKNLEQVIYFAGYIIKNINETARTEALEALKEEFTKDKKNIQTAYQASQNKKALAERGVEEQESGDEEVEATDAEAEVTDEESNEILTQEEYARQLDELTEEYNEDKKRLESLHVYQILSELEYRELSMFYGHVFQAGTGSEAVRDAIADLDLNALTEELTEQIRTSSGQRKTKLMKRLLLVENLVKGDIKPEWMILTHIPILPPDLRPMVALEGGRFAASDLNDLYRRIINRNNRLKRLLSIGAPEVICRNEKRMLQEAVDALINNSARGAKAVTKSGAGRLTLKSLSDSLKGKQGRFRQNLLGKRVDYSGRSVIVVGPKLKLNQCGLPKRMALELFKPFVISKLLREGYAYNAKNAEKLIEWDRPEVWDKLDEVIKNRYVLLNRAPTLHRLGIQAFQPVLIEGKAIQIHPLVCSAFNADFDGDQMAVHVPLSTNAQKEAATIMSAAKNILKPSEGKPILSPTQDMILGCYYLTSNDTDEVTDFTAVNIHEAITAYRLGHIGLRQMIKARVGEEIVETTAGRMIFNSFLPDELGFINKTFRKKDLSQLIADIYESLGTDTTALVVDEIKRIGFKFATKSGISIAYSDIKVPEEKKDIVKETEKKVMEIREHYMNGLYTVNERSRDTVAAWMECKNKVSDLVVDQADKQSSIFYMIDSAARGTWGNMAQMGAMKGNVTSSTGRTIELPVKASFKEGFETLEYFISTHSGRKGKTDTALKTATAGYLTRRLVDAVQDIIVRENDCQNTHGIIISKADSDAIGEKFENRILGRTLAVDLKVDGKVYLEKGHIISPDDIKDMDGKDIPEVEVRSILTCRTRKGVCASCYGYDLSNNKPVEIGTAVGIIAAQSIGEPGTQLTMRTFHSGGTADSKDITQGLPRVEELFEIRNPKTEAQIASISGKATIEYAQDAILVKVKASEKGFDEYTLLQDMEAVVEDGEMVKEKQVLSRIKGGKDYIKARAAGKVRLTEDTIIVDHTEFVEEEYKIDLNEELLVSDGEMVEAGQPLHRGHLNIKNLIDATDFITAQKYIMSEVQKIYATQGETVNDKHIEIIIRQIFSKARILDPGESGFIPGEVKDVNDILHTNYDLVKDGKKPIISQRMTLGLTRVSLETESWLSAASFQETIRTLVKASVTRQVDRLEGLKENVIIGKLLPSGAHFKKMYEANIQGESNLEDLEGMEEETEAVMD